MKYKEIISKNCAEKSAIKWWPKFAYHCTDVRNAVSIIASGWLYSRTNAEKLGLMKNDNASRQVIDMTVTESTANVRFYFRPLTPTQYYNEGFKHHDLRYDGDKNANMPVPVFFAFDLDKLLDMQGVKFSEKTQSGYGSKLYETIEDFSKFDFEKIYSVGPSKNWEDIKKYRHAEILYPGKFEISSCINAILCRNSVEKNTLLNLLKNENSTEYYRYKSMIKICRTDMFENNGLFIDGCEYHNNTISISFSDTYSKRYHCRTEMKKANIESLELVSGRLELRWLNNKRTCYKTLTEVVIDYINPKPIIFTNIPNIAGAKSLEIKFYIEENIMCCTEHIISDVELIK